MKKISLNLGGSLMLVALLSFNLHAASAGYEKGFYIQSADGDYKIKTNIQLMPQYQFVAIEGAGKVNTFQMRKARLILSGHAFNPDVTYKFQLEAVGGGVTRVSEGAAQGGPNLRDAYLNYKYSDGLQLMVGQFKPRFNREELTSSSKLQFVDRSVSNEIFNHGRDIGIDIHGKFLDGQLGYDLYVQNEGANRNATNPNNEFLTGFRLLWNAMGKHGYSMSDVKHSEDHQLAFGLGANLNFLTAAGDPTFIGLTGDVAYKYAGFSFHGEGNYMRNHTATTNIFGGLAQAGYFLIPKKFEAALRGAFVVPTAAGVVNGYETGVGLNYFFYGHNLKVQLDYNLLWNSALVLGATSAPANVVGGSTTTPGFIQNQNDSRVRLQTQLYF
jgi:phosphate-selective porin OprO and OprP